MTDYSFCDGFYVNGPIDNNGWSVYLCCGKQFPEDSRAGGFCTCDKSLMMKVSLKEENRGDRHCVIVSVFISDQPSVRFIITEKMGTKLRELFQQDCNKNKKSYANLVGCLFKEKRTHGDDLETKSMIQGLVVYIVWSLLALSGNNIGQGYFSTFLSQLGQGVDLSDLKMSRIVVKVSNSGKRFIKADEHIVKALLSYKFMLSLDTVQQTLLNCGNINTNWVKICLAWNRCIRPFFYTKEDIEDDLSTSSMYGIIMSMSFKNKELEAKMEKLEQSLANCNVRETPTSNSDITSTTTEVLQKPPIKQPRRMNREKSPEPAHRFRARSPVVISSGLARNILKAESKWKIYGRSTEYDDDEVYKGDKPEHLYEF